MGGNAADAPQAAWLLATLPENVIVLADKAYDADAIRRLIEARGSTPNIPFKTTVDGRAASVPSCTKPEMPLSACSAA